MMAAVTQEQLLEKSSDLHRRFWSWRLSNFPKFATEIADHRHNQQLDDFSLKGFQDRFSDSTTFLNEVATLLNSFQQNRLPCVDLEVLKYGLQIFVDGFTYQLHLCPINAYEGPHITLPYVLTLMPKTSAKDYDDILSRMRLVADQIDMVIELMKEGIRKRITSHSSSILPVINQYKRIINLANIDNPFFRTFKNKPDLINADIWEEIVAQAHHITESSINPSFKKLIDFLEVEYIPNTRQHISIATLPSGDACYRACLSFHTSTDIAPAQVRDIGLKEVNRIQKRMNEFVAKMNFQGTYKELIDDLKSQDKSKFQSVTEMDMVTEYSELYDRALEKMPQGFLSFPSQKCTIKTMVSSASNVYKSGVGEMPGTFWVNISDAASSSFTFVSLGLHEMIPGHHLQRNIIQQKDDTVNFRKFKETGNYWNIPHRFPLFTALMEGWGMYAEFLGEELGMYTTPNGMIRRLYSELFRAARLVVDTGIHAFDWTKEEAVNYLMDVVGCSEKSALKEVERYIVWPGQACSYKIGELKLKEYRDMLEKELGENFDVKEFHEVLLHIGEVPFEIIEKTLQLYLNLKKSGNSFDVKTLRTLSQC